MRARIAAATFSIVSVLLSPVSLTGYALWVGSLLINRRSGVSATAQGPLSARWFQHLLGTREDQPAARLMRVLPGVPPLVPQLVAGPLLLAHRLTGYIPRAFRYPFEGDVSPLYQVIARTAFFDKAVEHYLATIEQFVVLGAGFDTRVFRLPKDTRVRSFEVDTPKTQAIKREMVQQAGIDTSRVTFVAADFEQESWLDRLVTAGFAADRPALFLWEGVCMYLDDAAVVDTLRSAASTAEGSVVAFDYMTSEVLTSPALYWRYARATTSAGAEPLKFGIDSTPPSHKRLAELLRSCGLTLEEHRTPWDKRQRESARGVASQPRV